MLNFPNCIFVATCGQQLLESVLEALHKYLMIGVRVPKYQASADLWQVNNLCGLLDPVSL